MSRYQTELERHIEKYAGPIEFRFENLLVVRATENRASHLVVTTDLSDNPMPKAKPEWHFAELCALLPPDWSLNSLEWQNNIDIGWPMRELQRLTRYGRETGTWLGFGHSVPNGNPPAPFAPSTLQCASFLIPPLELPERFARLRLDDGEILNFWAIVPIYATELAVKVNQKAPTLIEKLTNKGISDVIDPTRDDVFVKSKDPKTWQDRLLGR